MKEKMLKYFLDAKLEIKRKALCFTAFWRGFEGVQIIDPIYTYFIFHMFRPYIVVNYQWIHKHITYTGTLKLPNLEHGNTLKTLLK